MTDLLTGKTFYYVYLDNSVYKTIIYMFNNGVGNFISQDLGSSKPTTPPSYQSSTATPILTYTGTGTTYSITFTTGVDIGKTVTATLSADGKTLTFSNSSILNTDWASTVVNTAPSPLASTSPSPDSGSTPWKWWVWALIALAVIVVLGGFAFLMMGKK